MSETTLMSKEPLLNSDQQAQLIQLWHIISADVYMTSKANGFWEDGVNRNRGEMIALMHSELSECLEGVRKNTMDDHIPEFSSQEAELADTIIRIMDYGSGFKLRIMEAVIAKMAYNKNRPYKHGKAF